MLIGVIRLVDFNQLVNCVLIGSDRQIPSSRFDLVLPSEKKRKEKCQMVSSEKKREIERGKGDREFENGWSQWGTSFNGCEVITHQGHTSYEHTSYKIRAGMLALTRTGKKKEGRLCGEQATRARCWLLVDVNIIF